MRIPEAALVLIAFLSLAGPASLAGEEAPPPGEATAKPGAEKAPGAGPAGPGAAATRRAAPADVMQSLKITGLLESGFLAVLSHSVQFGRDGTVFSYKREGGQDTLFQVTRASAELEIDARHKVVFLYQPLSLRTTVSLERTLRVDGLDFPAGTAINLVYDFPFYRLSYLYDAAPRGIDELSFGLSLQLRNARISFCSVDGSLFRDNRNVGPVPLLKFRGRFSLDSTVWFGAELDWIYAPVSYLNGSDTEVTGALLDASLRAGVTAGRFEAFLNLRYLSGGATGTSDEAGPGDGFVSNWLDFLTVTLGLSVSL